MSIKAIKTVTMILVLSQVQIVSTNANHSLHTNTKIQCFDKSRNFGVEKK